jgi:hypothetical protein
VPRLGPALLVLWCCALVAGAVTWGLRLVWLGRTHVPVRWEAIVLLAVFAAAYGAGTLLARVPQATALASGLRRRLARQSA